jgi:hypothetical protein
MAFASGAEHSLFYVAESVAGVTPATPAFKTFRHTGTTLALTKDAIQSEELGGRRIRCFRHGNKQVGGDGSLQLSYGDFDDMLEAALCGTWTANVLKTGSVRRSFTFERFFADIAQRVRYTGVEVNELSLSVSPNAIVTGSLSFIGLDQDPVNTMLAGSTYAAPSAQCPFDSFSGSIVEGGAVIGVVTQLEMSLANGIEPLFAVGSNSAAGKSIGRTNVTGTMTVYFEDMTLLNKFVNETSSSLVFSLEAEDGSVLSFNLPNVKYNGGQPDVSGDGAITLSMPFQALYDSTEASELVITRTPA